MSARKKLLSLTLALCLTWSLAAPALASESAASIRLSKTTGTVTVSKSSEKPLTLLSNMRLYNGYHVTTGAKSYAWMNLDDTKLIKEDASSEVEVRKDGKKLTVNVCSGNVFFNVSEKLKDDESLNISTSTMIVGIRGTAGYVQTEDKSTTRITILEGSARCSVTDPVTGQIETATVQSGQTATCRVNSEAEPGDKCSIRTESQTVESIPGFVLTDVVRDMELCERIQEDTGTDVLAELARIVGGDPSGKAPDGKAASPEILGEADRRESEDDSDRQKRQQQAEEARARENDDISTDKALAPKDEGTSGGGAGGGSGGGSSTPSRPSGPVTVNLTMPVTVPEVQTALSGAGVVNLRQSTASTAGSTLTVEAGAVLDVASGKTLHMEAGVDMAVNGSLHVSGTVTGNNITSSGDITVNSADTLYVKGNLTSTDSLTVTGTGKLVVDGDFSHKDAATLFLSDGAQVLSKNGFGGVLLPESWIVSDTKASYNDAEYFCLTYAVPRTVTFDAAGGQLTGGNTAATTGGKLSSLPTPSRTANTGGTATYTFGGWYTAAQGGEQVTTDTVFTADTTVYARWSSSGGWDWALDGTSLQIFGAGAMTDFAANAGTPWGTDLTGVAVEAGITGVGDNAFNGCTGLTSVTLPGSVAVIGASAFSGCTGLTGIRYGGTREEWGRLSFDDPTGGQVVIHCSDGDLAVYTVTFEGNGGTVDGASTSLDTSLSGTLSALPTATRSASTGGTATYTFDGWYTAAEGGEQITASTVFTADTTVYALWISSGGWDWALDGTTLRIFGAGAMTDFAAASPPWDADKDNISTVILDTGITSVGMGAFSGCSNLTGVTLPEGVETIGSYAFSDCTSLAAIALPDTLTSLGTNFAFSNCTSLNSVVIPSKVTSIPQYTFQSCTGLTSLSVPVGVTAVDSAAFDGCTGLTISYGGTEDQWNSILSGTLPAGVTVTFDAL